MKKGRNLALHNHSCISANVCAMTHLQTCGGTEAGAQSLGLKICGLVDLEDEEDEAVSVSLAENKTDFTNKLSQQNKIRKMETYQWKERCFKVTQVYLINFGPFLESASL